MALGGSGGLQRARWRRGGIGKGLQANGVGAPSVKVLAQTLVLLAKLFELVLQALRHRAKGDGAGQLLLAGQDARADDFGIVGIGPEFEVMIVVVNGCRRVGFFLIVETAQLEMGRGGARVDLEGLFKRIKSALVIHRVEAGVAGQEVRVLLFVQTAHCRPTAKRLSRLGI